MNDELQRGACPFCDALALYRGSKFVHCEKCKAGKKPLTADEIEELCVEVERWKNQNKKILLLDIDVNNNSVRLEAENQKLLMLLQSVAAELPETINDERLLEEWVLADGVKKLCKEIQRLETIIVQKNIARNYRNTRKYAKGVLPRIIDNEHLYDNPLADEVEELRKENQRLEQILLDDYDSRGVLPGTVRIWENNKKNK